jgi:hypothetical protein
MSKREIRNHLMHARAQLGRAIMDIRAAKEYTDNGPHKHLCEQIVVLTDVLKNLLPNDPHLDLE